MKTFAVSCSGEETFAGFLLSGLYAKLWVTTNALWRLNQFHAYQLSGTIKLTIVVTTAEPMPLRELGYLSAIVRRDIGLPTAADATRLHSVVIDVSSGAGRQDNGAYAVPGIHDQTTLRWQYPGIRLWELEARDLLA